MASWFPFFACRAADDDFSIYTQEKKYQMSPFAQFRYLNKGLSRMVAGRFQHLDGDRLDKPFGRHAPDRRGTHAFYLDSGRHPLPFLVMQTVRILHDPLHRDAHREELDDDS